MARVKGKNSREQTLAPNLHYDSASAKAGYRRKRIMKLHTNEMLLAAVSRRTKLPAAQLCDELLAEIKEFAMGLDFTDDVCLVGMEVAGEK